MPQAVTVSQDAAATAAERAARMAAIQDAIGGALADELGEAGKIKAAAEDLDGMRVTKEVGRLANFATLADLAADGEWTTTEVEHAATAVSVKRFQGQKVSPTVQTFMGELRLVMHPNVRDDYRRIADSVKDAWDIETATHEADKNAPTPIRKAFKRKYHFLVRTLRQAEEGNYFATQADLARWVSSCDPDLDPAKLFKALEKARDALREVNDAVYIEDVKSALDVLDTIEAGAYKAALGLPAKAPTSSARSATSHVVKPAPVIAPTNAPAPAATVAGVEPLEGAVDLDAFLADAA